MGTSDAAGLPHHVMAALVAALLLAGGLAYSTSFRGVLVLDDIRAIARNPTITSLSTATTPPGESTVAGRPLANVSFALNYALAPADVRDVFSPEGAPGAPPGSRAEAFLRNIRGYHALNLAIHLAAGLVLFGILRRTIAKLEPRATPGTAAGEARLKYRATPGTAAGGAKPKRRAWRDVPIATWLAFAAALLWVVHPLHTESVTYVVQRVESLMGLFYLLTLYCAIRAGEGRRVAAWSAASIASCALGMATKEVMVTAPILVVLWDWVFGRRPLRPSRRWLWAGLAATWVILVMLVVNEHRAPSVDLGQGMAWRYLVTQAGVIVHYLRLAAFPSPLVFLYTWPVASSITGLWPQLAMVGCLVALSALALARRRPIGFAGAWFLLILAPTSSLLPIVTEVAAEHRMYLPLAALAACVVVGAARAGGWLLDRLAPAHTRVRRAVAVSACLVVVILAVTLGAATAERNRDYWSEEALWRDTVEAQPDNPRARIAYGQTLLGQRRLVEAETQLREAVRLAPIDPVGRGRLGAVLAAQGRIDEALTHFERAVEFSRGRDLQALMMLCAAQADARRFREAAETAGAALQLARSQGRSGLADELERRAATYRSMALGR